MEYVTTTLGDLIDRALYELEAPSERGIRVVMGTTVLDSTVATQFTLSTGSLHVSDLVEFGAEMLLVTAVSDATDPIYTVARGYYGTTAGTYAAGEVGVANPQFARRRVADAIDRSFNRIEAFGVVPVYSSTATPTDGLLEVPAAARQVLQLLYQNSEGFIVELDRWREFTNLPTALSSTGRGLRMPDYVQVDVDELHMVYSSRFEWTGTFPDETATVDLPAAGADLPAVFAAAWLVAGREVSRAEIDRSNEQSPQDQVRVQTGTGLVRAKWQEFYRSLDEAMRVLAFEIPKHRPFIQRPKVT